MNFFKCLILISVVIIFIRCNGNVNPTPPESANTDTTKAEIEEVVGTEADDLSDAFVQNPPKEDTSIVPATAAGRGASERQWKDLLKNVFANAAFRKPVYFGVSSRKGVGTIIDKRQEVIRVLSQMINPEEYSKFLVDANSGRLDAKTSKDFNFNLLFDTRLLSLDTAISGHIARSDSSSFDGGTWESKELIWGTLQDSMNSNLALSNFRTDLNDKDNLIISKVIKITGFSSKIYMHNDMGLELRAKLDTTIAKIPSTNAILKFHVVNNRTITASSDGFFYVYGVVSKKKTR